MSKIKEVLPLTCFVFAGLVAMTGNDGWGWLLAIGVLIWGAS